MDDNMHADIPPSEDVKQTNVASQKAPLVDGNSSDASASSNVRRSPRAPARVKVKFHDVLSGEPPPKRKRSTSAGSSSSSSTSSETAVTATIASVPKKTKDGRQIDRYCWLCHKEGDDVICTQCPRVYHFQCLGPAHRFNEEGVCPECRLISVDGTDINEALSSVQLSELLPHALHRMTSSSPILTTWPPYDKESIDLICIMDLSTLQQNIKKNIYKSTISFLSDVKWIVHNCIIIYGANHIMSTNAKSILKMCRAEMLDIESCFDCYQQAYTFNENWFCQPCRVPHTLVWAKLKGFPFWPSKAVKVIDGVADVRFFGSHEKSKVPVTQCYLLSRENPNDKPSKNINFKNALEEVEIYIKNIKDKFGDFQYAPPQTVYDPGPENFISKNPLKKPNVSLSKPKRIKNTSVQNQSQEGNNTIDNNQNTVKYGNHTLEATSKQLNDETTQATNCSLKESNGKLVPSAEHESGKEDSTCTEKIHNQKEYSSPHKAMLHKKNFMRHLELSKKSPQRNFVNDLKAADNCLSEQTISLKIPECDDNKSNSIEDSKLIVDQLECDKVKSDSDDDLENNDSDEKNEIKTPDLSSDFSEKVSSPSSGNENKESENSFSDSGLSSEKCENSDILSNQSDSGKEVTKDIIVISDDSHIVISDDSQPQKAELIPAKLVNVTDNEILETVSNILDSVDFYMDDESNKESNNEQDFAIEAIAVDFSNELSDILKSVVDTVVLNEKSSESVINKNVDLINGITISNIFNKNTLITAHKSINSSDKDSSVDSNVNCDKIKIIAAINNAENNVAQTNETLRESKFDNVSAISDCNLDDETEKVKCCSTDSSTKKFGIARNCIVTLPCKSQSENIPSDGILKTCQPCVTITDTKKTLETNCNHQISSAVKKQSHIAINNDSSNNASERKGNDIKEYISAKNDTAVSAKHLENKKDNHVLCSNTVKAKNCSNNLLVTEVFAETVQIPPCAANSSSANDLDMESTEETDSVNTNLSKDPVDVPASLKASHIEVDKNNSFSRSNEECLLDVCASKEKKNTEDQTAHIDDLKDSTGINISAQKNTDININTQKENSDVVSQQLCSIPLPDGPNIDKYSDKVFLAVRSTIEEIWHDFVNVPNIQKAILALQKEISDLKQKHQQDLTEITSNTDLILNEMKTSLEQEKQKAVEEIRKQCETEKQKAIEETKKKQWCANCGREAIFYCCWNTSYCDYPCQQSHWPEHMASCAQTQQFNEQEMPGDADMIHQTQETSADIRKGKKNSEKNNGSKQKTKNTADDEVQVVHHSRPKDHRAQHPAFQAQLQQQVHYASGQQARLMSPHFLQSLNSTSMSVMSPSAMAPSGQPVIQYMNNMSSVTSSQSVPYGHHPHLNQPGSHHSQVPQGNRLLSPVLPPQPSHQNRQFFSAATAPKFFMGGPRNIIRYPGRPFM